MSEKYDNEMLALYRAAARVPELEAQLEYVRATVRTQEETAAELDALSANGRELPMSYDCNACDRACDKIRKLEAEAERLRADEIASRIAIQEAAKRLNAYRSAVAEVRQLACDHDYEVGPWQLHMSGILDRLPEK